MAELTIPQLRPADCKYMQSEDVARYTATVDFFKKCEGPLLRQGQEAVVLDLRRKLCDAATVMGKSRMRIGFVGPSQVGKSASIANLLKVKTPFGPTPEGGGLAMTTAPTRIRRAAEASIPSGELGKVTLHYMTKAEFRKRLFDICDDPKARHFELSPEKELRQLIADVAALETNGDLRPGDADTYRYLKRFLESGKQFESMLALTPESRVIDPGVYNDRRMYVADEDNTTRHNKYLLLKEVIIDFKSTLLPEDLDVIDLPGLGTTRLGDNAVTRDYLPELQGAFVFQRASQLTDGSVAELLNALHEQFVQELQGRIWYVVTYLDRLEPAQLSNPDDTILHKIARRMKEYRLQDDAAILLGNRNYQDLLENGPESRRRDPGVSELGWCKGANGDPEPVAELRTPEFLGKLYAEVVRDGGAPLLQRTAMEQVRKSVETQLRKEVGKRLDVVLSELERHLEHASTRSKLPLEALTACATWEEFLATMRMDALKRNYSYIEGPIWDLQKHLEDITAGLVTASRVIDKKKMKGKHETVAKMLRGEALKQSIDKLNVVKNTFDKVVEIVNSEAANRRRANMNSLPLIGDSKKSPNTSEEAAARNPLPDPLAALKYRLNETAQAANPTEATPATWATEVFDAFFDEFPGVEDAGKLDTYQRVVLEKTSIVSRAFAARLIHEIDQVLIELEDSLGEISSSPERIGDGDGEVLLALLNEIKAL